MRRRMLRHNLQ